MFFIPVILLQYKKMDPKSIISTYKDYLNDRNTDGLLEIITDTMVFIDSSGHTIMGKQACMDAWESFCRLFPDYHHVFEEVVNTGDKVYVRGHSTCSDTRVEGPVLWSAKIKGERVDEWRVHKDTEENRVMLGLSKK